MEKKSKLKTALFGGTFDPFHLGHVELLAHINEEIGFDRIVIIPSGHPYFKEEMGRKITSVEDRIGMIEAGIADLHMPLEISHIETDKDTPSYSVETVTELKTADIEIDPDFRNSDYYFLCGSDILFEVERWHDFRRFLNEVILSVTTRGDRTDAEILEKKEELESKYSARIRISSYRGRVISSSAIRNDLESSKDLIPMGTYEYIKEHHLYERKD